MYMNNHMHRALQETRKKERKEKGRERKKRTVERKRHTNTQHMYTTINSKQPSPQLHRNKQNCSPNVLQTLGHNALETSKNLASMA